MSGRREGVPSQGAPSRRSLLLAAAVLLGQPTALRATDPPVTDRGNPDYVLEYFLDDQCTARSANDAEFWWWNDIAGEVSYCGRMVGISGGNNTWGGPYFVEENREINPGVSPLRFLNVPSWIDGGLYYYPTPRGPHGGPWQWTINFESPITLYIFEEDGPGSVLDARELQADEWYVMDGGDFVQSPGLQFHRQPLRVWSKDMYTMSEYTITITGDLKGGVAQAFDCVHTSTSTTSRTTTATTTSTGTTTPHWSYLMGPHAKFGFRWFLAAPGINCDNLCAGMNGANLNPQAVNRWPDRCESMLGNMDDITIFFFEHGNKCNWTGDRPDSTDYRSLGHGYVNGRYYQKCAEGSLQDSGSWPGENNIADDRCLVCTCFRDGRRLDDDDGAEPDDDDDDDAPAPAPQWTEALPDAVDDVTTQAQAGWLRGSRRLQLGEPEELEYVGGPVNMHGYRWYLSQPGGTCDAVCAEVGGANLNLNASAAWSDWCYSGLGRDADRGWDVASHFFENGNPGGWTQLWRYPSGPTDYFTLGYGYPGGKYFHKCAAGSQTGTGALPGDINNDPQRNTVCACSLADLYDFGEADSENCPRGYRSIEDVNEARAASEWFRRVPGADFVQLRPDRPKGMFRWGNSSLFALYFNRITVSGPNPRGFPVCKRQLVGSTSELTANGCYTGFTQQLGADDREGSLMLRCDEDTLRWGTYNLDKCEGPFASDAIPLVEVGRLFLKGHCMRRGGKFVKLNRRITDTHLRHMSCPEHYIPFAEPSTAHLVLNTSCYTPGSSGPADDPMSPRPLWWVLDGHPHCFASQEFSPLGLPTSDVEYFSFRCECPDVLMLRYDLPNCTGAEHVVFSDSWERFQGFFGVRGYCYGPNSPRGVSLSQTLLEVSVQSLPAFNCPLPTTIFGQPEACTQRVDTSTATTTITTAGEQDLGNTSTSTTSSTTTDVSKYWVPTTIPITTTSSYPPAPLTFPAGLTPQPPWDDGGNPNVIGVARSVAAGRRSPPWLVAVLLSAAAAFSSFRGR